MTLLFMIVLLSLCLASYLIGERKGYSDACKDWENVIRIKDETIVNYQQALDKYLR